MPVPRHVLKTEATFTAEDPWNNNLRSTFTLDNYVWLSAGSPVPPNGRPRGYYRRGLCPASTGLAYDIPASLYYAWIRRQVPAERLPQLLHELKPQLKSDDYGVMLSDRVLTAVVWTFGIFFALAIVVLFSPSTWPADLPPWIWIPMATVITIPIAKVFYSRIFRTLRRRKEQTKWILARL
jgi:hypothetical protein